MKYDHTPRAAAWLSALVLILAVIGCSDDPAPTAPEEEPMDVPRVTETFEGMFGMDENSEHQFTVTQTGDVSMKITSLEPVPTLTVGMGIGVWDAASDPACAIFASDGRVVVNAELVSARVEPGEYCVRVGDVGNVFPDAIVTYTVEVTHP